MKKLILFVAAFMVVATTFAQSEKYMKAMQDKVAAIDTTWDQAKLKDLSAAFERIGDAEKTQWLPYYYAALCQVNMGLNMSQNGEKSADKVDPVADKAEQLISKAEDLSKDNSEIYVVRKMIANLRMMPGEMARYQKYGPEGAEALANAKRLNTENPRVTLLEAEDKMFTPEAFGGSKTEAKKLFDEAIVKFGTFKPASTIDPSWGRATAEYLMGQLK